MTSTNYFQAGIDVAGQRIQDALPAGVILLIGALLVTIGIVILVNAVKEGSRFGWGVWRPGSPFNRLPLGVILIVIGVFFLKVSGLVMQFFAPFM